jgi:hypothetical protein
MALSAHQKALVHQPPKGLLSCAKAQAKCLTEFTLSHDFGAHGQFTGFHGTNDGVT